MICKAILNKDWAYTCIACLFSTCINYLFYSFLWIMNNIIDNKKCILKTNGQCLIASKYFIQLECWQEVKLTRAIFFLSSSYNNP